MTLMTPKEWFESIVEPNYQEYLDSPNDERRAFNAILSTHHFWDRVYHYWRLTDASKLLQAENQAHFVRHLIDKHGSEIEMLHDVANALKHHFLDRRTLGRDPNQLWATTATDLIYKRDSIQAEGELEIMGTGRTVKDVLTSAIGYCRLWC